MAFVFCDERWRGKVEVVPGPGQYDGGSLESKIKLGVINKDHGQPSDSSVNLARNTDFTMPQKTSISHAGNSEKGRIMKSSLSRYDNTRASTASLNHQEINVKLPSEHQSKIKEILRKFSLKGNRSAHVKKQMCQSLLKNDRVHKNELEMMEAVVFPQKNSVHNLKRQLRKSKKGLPASILCSTRDTEHEQLKIEANSISLETSNQREEVPQARHEKRVHILESIPTGIEDDSQTELSNESQFVKQCTPGPGSYHIETHLGKSKLTFTTSVRQILKSQEQSGLGYYTIKEPSFKRSSLASQKCVGFGAAIQHKKQEKEDIGPQFYENTETIERKALNKMIKALGSPSAFSSGQSRFPIQQTFDIENKNVLGTASLDEEVKQSNLGSVFASNVKRIPDYSSITAGIEFRGQSYESISDKLETRALRREIYGLSTPGPLKIVQSTLSKEQERQLRKQCMKQLRKEEILKMQEVSSAPQNGYTFPKRQRPQQLQETRKISPVSEVYNVNPKWCKRSFNSRFRTNQGVICN